MSSSSSSSSDGGNDVSALPGVGSLGMLAARAVIRHASVYRDQLLNLPAAVVVLLLRQVYSFPGSCYCVARNACVWHQLPRMDAPDTAKNFLLHLPTLMHLYSCPKARAPLLFALEWLAQNSKDYVLATVHGMLATRLAVSAASSGNECLHRAYMYMHICVALF